VYRGKKENRAAGDNGKQIRGEADRFQRQKFFERIKKFVNNVPRGSGEQELQRYLRLSKRVEHLFEQFFDERSFFAFIFIAYSFHVSEETHFSACLRHFDHDETGAAERNGVVGKNDARARFVECFDFFYAVDGNLSFFVSQCVFHIKSFLISYAYRRRHIRQIKLFYSKKRCQDYDFRIYCYL
jgi:hypothetical protein